MDFAKKLLDWYRANARELPFRGQKDPYKIWVSEIMSQQTRMETVIPYYLNWIERFPDLQALARADLDEVLKAWQGLGYYSRAKNMHKAANLLVNQYRGAFPTSKEELMKLPGIGDYTAGAIASIAFDEKCSAIDGNVIRVFSRIFELKNDFSKKKEKDLLDLRILELIENPALFNQAVMELGSEVCTPKNPRCQICPLSKDCQAFLNDRILLYPYKKPVTKKKAEMKTIYVHLFKDPGDEKLWIRLVKKENGLLNGLYGFDEKVPEVILQKIPLTSYEHVFTHKIWKMEGWLCLVDRKDETFIPVEQAEELAIPTAFMPFYKEVVQKLDEYKDGKNIEFHEQMELFKEYE